MVFDYLEDFKRKNGYELNGIWYPRVTSICDIVHKPGLLKYYAQQPNFAAAQDTLNKAADWGKLTHSTIEALLGDKKIEIDPIISPSIRAFDQWRFLHRIRPLDFEKKVISDKHIYVGTIDALVEIDGKLGILDLKTGSGIWDEYSLQTVAYFQAFNEKEKKKAETRWILRIDQYQECQVCGAKKREKGGKIRINGGSRNIPPHSHQWGPIKGEYEFKEFEDHKQDLKAFLAAKKLWEWVNRNMLFKIESYLGNRKQNGLF